MHKKIIICGNHIVPNNHPNASRLLSFAQIFIALGYEVLVVGLDDKSEKSENGIYYGIQYKRIGYYNVSRKQRNHNFKKSMYYILTEFNPCVILITSSFYNIMQHTILKYAQKHRIPIIQNVVEWYDITNNSFRGLIGKLRFINNRISLSIIFPIKRNIIAISSLLENYYRGKRCNVVRIPTIVNMDEYTCLPKCPDEKLVLSYAGMPAKKDLLINVIIALSMLNESDRKRVIFRIYGPQKEDLVSLGLGTEMIDALSDTVFCMGKIPYEEVKLHISHSDFTVLLRPDKRYANAGFPTKVGESMACGVPVIANLTSDLGMYLIDGETGVVCENETPQACCEAIKRALNFTNEQKISMRVKAYNMAKEAFSYTEYIQSIKLFMENLK